ncbi:hypothetical protein CSUI_010831 [Cystoisospora suis]|uniref:Uncharacterized protein n=1 Tax=Cystoisospora suis TaxID=483139 RepID=A0A2C6KFC3_9APIC|nr:hypothetical protein CSUI_010831 [Cystoisospora suis]
MRERGSEGRQREAVERKFVLKPQEGTFFATEKGPNESLRSEGKEETEINVFHERSLRGEARAEFMTFRRNSFSKRDSLCDESYSFPPAASASQVSYQPFCSPPFCSPTVCSLPPAFVSPLRQPASRPPSLLSSSSRGLCFASRASTALDHSTAEVLTPQSHRRGSRRRFSGSRFRSESGVQPYNSFSSPRPRPPSSSPRPVGTSLCSVPPQAPSSADPSAASSVRRRGSESSVLSGSMILAVAAKASNFKHLPPPLSPFKGPPRPGAAEAARRRRRQQRRQERERRRVKQSAECKTEKENIPPRRKEGDEGTKPARETSPSLRRTPKQAGLLFSRPCGSERDSSPLSDISDSPSQSSCQSWMCGISPSSLSPLPAPPDLFWRSSPSAGSEPGRISLSSFPSSPSLLWGGRGCAPGSYFGSSGSLDHSSSSQVSNSSFCSSIVFAKPVLPPLANARVTSGGRVSGGEEEGTWRGDTGEIGQRAPSVRKGWQAERAAGKSPNSQDVSVSGHKHKKSKGGDVPAELCRERVNGCVFRPPSASVGRLGRRNHMVPSSSNTAPAAGSNLAGPGALSSSFRGGKPVGPCNGEAAGVSFFSASKAAPPGFFVDDSHLVSAGTRNPLSSGAMLLSASWGVSYHFPRNNKERGGGSALHTNGGSGILQSSPLVRRARRLSEGGAEGRVASRKSLECVGEGDENATHTAAAEALS